MRIWIQNFFVVAMLSSVISGVHAQSQPSTQPPMQPSTQAKAQVPEELRGVSVEEHLGAQLPLSTVFKDQQGRSVRLHDVLDAKRPVLLNLVYHSCPMLCNFVLAATMDALKAIPWTIGNEFKAIAISIDPRDTPQRASQKRNSLLTQYARPAAKQDWSFLVGTENNIQAVAKAVGFNYRYDNRQNEYAHPAVAILLTPDGRISRYLYGIDYSPQDLRLGLLEASEGRSISTLEKVLLYCYHYDPQGRKYVLAATRLMQLGALLTVLILGFYLVRMWKKEIRRRTVTDAMTKSNEQAYDVNMMSQTMPKGES